MWSCRPQNAANLPKKIAKEGVFLDSIKWMPDVALYADILTKKSFKYKAFRILTETMAHDLTNGQLAPRVRAGATASVL